MHIVNSVIKNYTWVANFEVYFGTQSKNDIINSIILKKILVIMKKGIKEADFLSLTKY